MKIIEAIREYISKLDCMKVFDNAINVNYLGDDDYSFSIEEVPCEPIVKQYINGSSERQYQFVFTSKEPYSEEILQNIENSSFYEDFANEIENKNYKKELPLLEGMKVPFSVVICLIYFAIMMVVSFMVFKKRNIKNV